MHDDRTGGLAPGRQSVTGQAQGAFARRADFEDRDAEQGGFDPAPRVRARYRVSTSEAASCSDPGVDHRDGRPAVPLHQSGEGVGALCRVWSDDEPPVAARLGEAVQEEVRVGLEATGVEGLACPHREPGGRSPARRSEQLFQVPPLRLAAQAGEDVEAGLPEYVHLGLGVARPPSTQGDVPRAHDDDVAAVQGRPGDRFRRPRPVLDVHRVRSVPLGGVRGQHAQGAGVVAQQDGVRPGGRQDVVEPTPARTTVRHDGWVQPPLVSKSTAKSFTSRAS
ncbi:hypothetical protein [Streptomyces tendae]|uniref:hypothetical protein n=1 Tax=Streptomyces tendae TaxID=1932 RepID=UPI00381B7874